MNDLICPFEATLSRRYKNGKGIWDNWHTKLDLMLRRNRPKEMPEQFPTPTSFF
jgi:hypothetical protein